jgi:hypothetical protein
MFSHAQLSTILFPAILVMIVISLAFRLYARRLVDPLRRAWVQFRLDTIVVGAMLLLLWFCLPITATLSTSGYPAGIEAVTQPQQLLNTLQEYNRALVRTTEVVYWLLFFFVWWFLTSLYAFSQAVAAAAGKKNSAN